MYLIEKGIPIPPSDKGGYGNSNRQYPFADMEVGDSFSVPLVRYPAMKSALVRAGRQFPNVRFITRIVGNCARCWRVS